MKIFYTYFLIILMTVSAYAETYWYSETFGGKAKPDFIWKLEKTFYGENLHSTRADRLITYWINHDGSNRIWKFTLPLENTDIVAEISGSTVSIKGKLKGVPIEKTHNVEGMWMQSMTYSLGVMIKSGKQSQEFYTIRPDNLELVKMKAVISGMETILLNEKNVDSYRVNVSLTGFLSGMWSSSFWYRKSDLKFIRYDGKQGLTESSRSVINFKK